MPTPIEQARKVKIDPLIDPGLIGPKVLWRQFRWGSSYMTEPVSEVIMDSVISDGVSSSSALTCCIIKINTKKV